MKVAGAYFLLLGILVTISCTETLAQSKKTIILVRHAEKDTSETADPGDPILSVQGVERARRLADKIKKYKVGAVYSTDYKRTRDTAEPTANRRNLKVRIYGPKKQNELIDQIMKSKTKRFLIVGHSNTIPALANLIVKKELFQPMDDSEFGTIWLIRIKNGRVTKVEIVEY